MEKGMIYTIDKEMIKSGYVALTRYHDKGP